MPVPAENGLFRSRGRDALQNRQSALRIVIVNLVFYPGDGTADALLERFTTLTGWAGAIQAEGAHVLVCQRFHRDAEQVERGVTYRFIADSQPPRPSSWFGGSEAMCAAARSFEPALVHVNGMQYPRAIRRLRRALPPTTSIVVQDHGGFEPGRLSRWRRRWMRRGLAAADMLLVATPEQAADFRRSGLVPPAVAIRDVMEGSTNFSASGARRDQARLNVLWVGRLNANKDPLTVLEGFARFAADRPEATLSYVYSSSELEAQLRSAIGRKAALTGRVKLAGAVPHTSIEDLYRVADLFVLGSHREGSGYAAIEAMACGVIPVLTDIPSFRGLTDGGRAGALWEPGNPDSLASALARATAGNIDARRAACRRRFEERFSWRAIGSRAMEIYRECSAR